MEGTAGEKLAALDQWARSHEKECDKDRKQIKEDTSEIKAAIMRLSDDVKGATQRFHSRLDEVQTDTAEKFAKVHGRISKQKVVALVAILGTSLTVLGYVVTTWGPLAHHEAAQAIQGPAGVHLYESQQGP